MDATPNFAIPIPKEGNSVADEFYRLMVAMGVIDEVLKAILDNANGRAPLEHTQTMSTITGLVDELAGKMPAGRVFKLDDLIDVDGADGAPAGYIVVKNGAGMWVPSSALAALGPHGHLMSEVTGLVAALSARPERAEVEDAFAELGNAARLNVGTTAGTVAAGDDARMTDARDWTASVISQAEAEAGVATTPRKWTAERVAQAIAALAPPAPQAPTVQVFTASGTWTKPTGLKWAKVTVVGGCGGGTSTSGAPGAGGTSSFGSHCSATGGGGGVTSGNGAGGSGGTGSGGDLNVSGQNGDTSTTSSSTHGGMSAFGLGRAGTATSSGGVTGGGGGGAMKYILAANLGATETVNVGAAGSNGSGSSGNTAGLVIVEEFY